MKLASYGKKLLTDPNCLSFIRKSLIGQVTLASAFGYEEKGYLKAKIMFKGFHY
jgi:hypothetical protein